MAARIHTVCATDRCPCKHLWPRQYCIIFLVNIPFQHSHFKFPTYHVSVFCLLHPNLSHLNYSFISKYSNPFFANSITCITVKGSELTARIAACAESRSRISFFLTQQIARRTIKRIDLYAKWNKTQTSLLHPYNLSSPRGLRRSHASSSEILPLIQQQVQICRGLRAVSGTRTPFPRRFFIWSQKPGIRHALPEWR